MTDDQPQNTKTEPDELEKCKQQCEEYLSNWKRERADFINYKKDESKRMEEFLKFGTEGIMLELIDVIDGIGVVRDNLPVTTETQNEEEAQNKMKGWIAGFDSSLEKLKQFLKKFGVEKIEVEGEKFDPHLHEVVTTETHIAETHTTETRKRTEKTEEDEERIEEIRPGYTMYGKVIRPARVKIIK